MLGQKSSGNTRGLKLNGYLEGERSRVVFWPPWTSCVKEMWQRIKEVKEGPLFWILPTGAVLIVFYLYPLFDVLRISFTDAYLIRPGYSYTLESYSHLLTTPDFFFMLRVTFIFVSASVLFQLLLGFFIALAINEGTRRGLPGTVVTRTTVLCAWILPGVVIGIIWRMLLSGSPYGVVNYLIERVGFNKLPFLFSPSFALVSVIIANIWRGTAFSMILQYAGLQKIPQELYEAAKVDGASASQLLRYVIIPQLRPMLFINLVLITIYTSNSFDMIIALTGGGPARSTEVIALNVYNTIFKFLDLGTGAAIAVILLFINLVMSLVYYRFLRVRTEVEI